MKKKLSGKYLKIFLSFAIILTVSIASFNIFFDSYGYFESRYGIKSKLTSFNQENIERVFKTFEINQYKPDLVILGTSRIVIGFVPSSLYKYKQKKIYNIGFNAARIYEIKNYIEYLHENLGVKDFIFALDPLIFKKNISDVQESFNIDLISSSKSKRITSSLFETIKYLISLKILTANMEALIWHETPDHNTFTHGSSDAQIMRFNVREKGFLHMNKRIIETHHKKDTLKNVEIHSDNTKKNYFIQILDYAKNNNINIDFIVSPLSADILDIYMDKNEYSTLLDWKRFLTTEIYAHNQNKNFELWDFGYYNKYTTSIRKNTDKEINGYYWEASHYTKELGDMMIDRIYGNKGHEVPIAGNLYNHFGLFLTPENIDMYINEMKKDAEKYYRPLDQNPSLKNVSLE